MRPDSHENPEGLGSLVIMRYLAWTPLVRVPAFVITFGLGYAGSQHLPILSGRSDVTHVALVLQEIGAGELSRVGQPQFAMALACAIVSTAAALAFAMLVTHVLVIRFSLFRARIALGRKKDLDAFKADFDRVDQKLSRHPLIGHSWQEFAKTCTRDGVILRTARPGAYFNIATVRENLPGLKIMPTLPGYFVGLGLLLTFIGLVIALSKAAGGVTGSPEGMTQSLRELLDAATFKFSTSIAGLFSSLVLAFVLKLYTVAIESGFHRFSEAVEARTTFSSSQGLLLQLARTESEQLQQLKAINDAQFFERLGQTIAPALATAVERAVQPLANTLEATVGKLEDANRSGAEGLLSKFTESLHGHVGVELREISSALAQTKDALSAVRGDFAGSGEAFAERMSAATERLERIFADAGGQFQANNQASRETAQTLLTALTGAAQAAKERADQQAAQAGSIATRAIHDGMSEMLGRVDERMTAFQATMIALQSRLETEAEAAARRSREAAEAAASRTQQAAEAAAAAASRAAVETAEAIRSGFADTVSQLRGDVERMAQALRTSEDAFVAQTRATRSTVEQVALASTAFGKVANDVTSASTPLLQASQRIATSTDTLAQAAQSAAESLKSGQEAARTLAERLEQGNRQIEAAWRNYEERFGAVDEALGNAVRALATETAQQQQGMTDFVVKIDEGCAKAVTNLSNIANALSENTSEIHDVFDDFLSRMNRPIIAAE